jgi:hypothetical protein
MEGGFDRQDTAVRQDDVEIMGLRRGSGDVTRPGHTARQLADDLLGVLLIPAISRTHETVLSYSEMAVR